MKRTFALMLALLILAGCFMTGCKNKGGQTETTVGGLLLPDEPIVPEGDSQTDTTLPADSIDTSDGQSAQGEATSAPDDTDTPQGNTQGGIALPQSTTEPQSSSEPEESTPSQIATTEPETSGQPQTDPQPSTTEPAGTEGESDVPVELPDVDF